MRALSPLKAMDNYL